MLRSLILALCLLPFAGVVSLGPEAAHAQTDEIKADADPACSGDECAPGDSTDNQAQQSADVREPEEEAEPEIDIAKMLGVQQLAVSGEERLDRVLNEYGLSTTFMGRVLATLIALTAALLLNFLLHKLIDRLFRYLIKLKIRFHLNLKRLAFYKRVLTVFGQLILLGLTLSGLAVVWRGSESGFNIGEKIVGFLSAISELAVLFAVGVILFELATSTMEHYFRRWAAEGSARINTLLPIARNVTSGALIIMFGMTMLSELGIDVMPLLAGAGVLGIAIGFGAQTLVKDLLNGFIIIFEDLIQVGDVANLGGKAGVVERITIRKVQLRDLGGSVFTVPFGEITIVENLTKIFSYYVFDVGIAYRESPDEVIALLKELGAELQADEEYKHDILEPIEVLGVDKFADSAIIIKARIKTLPIKQWRVGREFNRRMKYAFDARNIEIPFPHRTLYFGEDKNGESPAARFELAGAGAAGQAANDVSS